MTTYEIRIQDEEVSKIICCDDAFREIKRASMVVTDSNVLMLYGTQIRERFPSVPLYVMTAGE